MDLISLAKALQAKDVTLLKLINEGGQIVVLVRKNSDQELVCWYWNDLGFNSGIYGDDASRTFNARSFLISKG